MPRVLGSDTARQYIGAAQTKATSIRETLAGLNQDGQALAEPDNWDGALAAQFRSEWPTHSANFERALSSIDAVAAFAQKVNQSILSAGGNA
ncbi:MAG: hypothetical protein KAZ88_04615 [Acidimicrobiia bacterium]|jgi:uncharacterized protein YukE|nr:hypothetical protein [Acidimicrobiia bacterium]MBP8180256.1 hypothetical protein [Acidimicrobiia bacterium]